VLSAVKSAGRVPVVLPPDQVKTVELDLGIIPESDATSVGKILDHIQLDKLNHVVPIVMTSSAKGSGIRGLHALLFKLPIPPPPQSSDYIGAALNPEQPACLFHVEDTFDLPASYSISATDSSNNAGTVIAGYLRFGTLSVGDSIVVGPFPTESEGAAMNDNEPGGYRAHSSTDIGLSFPPTHSDESIAYERFQVSLSHPSASELTHIASHRATVGLDSAAEWHRGEVVSIRNLRLPVHTLHAGQVGTIGIVLDSGNTGGSITDASSPSNQVPRIRKGMVLAIPSRHMEDTGLSLQAASGFTASFEDEDVNSVTVGSLVVVYIASIRASARVVRLTPHIPLNGTRTGIAESDDMFGLDDDVFGGDETGLPIFGSDGITDVTLELMTNREWIELGSQVLIMSGGGQSLYYGSERGEKGMAGLEGFVGKVIEVVE